MGIKEILILLITLGVVLTSSNRDSGLSSQDKEAGDMKQGSIAETVTNPPSELRRIEFSNYNWLVKDSGQQRVGPKSNYFSDSKRNVWVDSDGQLHLKIVRRKRGWYCAEVISEKSFGHGKYVFYLANRVDQLDKNVVCGLFTWDDSSLDDHREIDIEFSKWGKKEGNNAQFTVQPSARQGNTLNFNIQLQENYSTHSFDWKEESIAFHSLSGYYPSPS
ncbi:unnamed protein product, partial [marine sediment metagenome]